MGSLVATVTVAVAVDIAVVVVTIVNNRNIKILRAGSTTHFNVSTDNGTAISTNIGCVARSKHGLVEGRRRCQRTGEHLRCCIKHCNVVH